jgi:outer membrane receptor for ferrienterochelin and colicins
MINRIEVVKGQPPLLYGSEAVGGLINIITKDQKQFPSLQLIFSQLPGN